MKNNTLLILLGIAAAGGAIYFMTHNTVSQKRAYLKSITVHPETFDPMSDDEINIAYKYLKEYVEKNKAVDMQSPFGMRLAVLSEKYHIFE